MVAAPKALHLRVIWVESDCPPVSDDERHMFIEKSLDLPDVMILEDELELVQLISSHEPLHINVVIELECILVLH